MLLQSQPNACGLLAAMQIAKKQPIAHLDKNQPMTPKSTVLFALLHNQARQTET